MIPVKFITDFRNPDKIVYIEAKTYDANGNPLTWAVMRNGFCMNYDGEFEVEPIPSSRDEAFLSRCRFESATMASTRYDLFYED